jgi:hypothetical protein
MADSVTYRGKKREDSVNRFLAGEARQPYILRPDISVGLKEQGVDPPAVEGASIRSPMCTCRETLGEFAEKFSSMVHMGRKPAYLAENERSSAQGKKCRDINQQNKWLLENVFDSYGNYIFCFSCVKTILGVGGSRLRRLREIKQQEVKTPTIRVRKDHVSKDQTRDVVTPANVTNVIDWWANLDDDSIVELRLPPKLHCGQGNNRKEHLLKQFLEFIDNNSQPNGRRVGSHGPLYFLNSKFTRINTPSASETGKPEQWKGRSLVYEYNRTLRDNEHISNGTAKKWLKEYRPKCAICPQKTDYCEMCVECQEQVRRHETIAMRLRQEGNGIESEIRENEALAESYRMLLDEHRQDAANELQHYKERIRVCQSTYNEIMALRQNESKSKKEEMKLVQLIDQITFVLSLDYQQSKLTPHWGYTAQPSETYYLRKLSHNIFGIVDHTLSKEAIYVADERVAGAKNADMTISLVDHYIRHNFPSWVRHLCLFMDNGTTNKSQFIIQWAMELVDRADYDSIRMCFFVPGHGKNDVDRLFARISHAFNKQDVFGSEKLQELIQNTIAPTGVCLPASNQDIVNWKNLLGMKYTSFKGIKSYRDFLVKRNAKGEVVVNYKECCYIGDYDYASLLKNDANSGLDLMKKASEYTYRKKGLSSKLSQDKVNDLVKMYDRLIDPSFRPDWLPISQSILASCASASSPSACLARQHRATVRKGKKEKKDSKSGCT